MAELVTTSEPTESIMKTNKLNIAIIACTFGITACVGTAETNQEKLGKVSPSTYASALTPNGDVDCDAIDNALLQYGIDPAQLEPQVVFEACLDSGEVSEDECERVAFTCFGEQDECADGHGDEDDHNDNEGDDQLCQMLEDQAANAGIDLDNMAEDEVFWKCIDQGVDEATCHEVIDRCLSDDTNENPDEPNEDGTDKPDGEGDNSDNPDDPNADGENTDKPEDANNEGDHADGDGSEDSADGGGENADGDSCQAIRDEAEANGLQTPISEDKADVIFAECIDQGFGEQDCLHVVECLTQP